MKFRLKPRENGQSLILVALLMVVFVGILALVLDGGYTYFMRRNAQNAADAGALAGARIYCETLSEEAGREEAMDYVHNNEALVYPNDSPLDIQIAGNKVTVDTVIEFNNFFGQLFSREQRKAVAHAVAGCYSPSLAEGVLPIIWFCKPSLTGEIGEEDPVCIEQFIDEGDPGVPGTLLYYLANPAPPPPDTVWPELYIVMDSLSYNVDFPCYEDEKDGAYMFCDFDGDGDKDHFAGGGRSWTDLDGKTGLRGNPDCPPSQDQTTELTAWILDGFGCALDIQTWTPEVTGDVDKIFQAIECRINNDACKDKNQVSKGPIVMLPVYDDFCLHAEPNPDTPVDCDKEAETPPEIKWYTGDQIRYTDPGYFHIVHFAPFYITCVRGAGRSWTPDGQVSTCPGYEAFKETNKDEKAIPQINSVATVEGYFLHGYVSGLKGRGGDDFLDRVFTVYLDE